MTFDNNKCSYIRNTNFFVDFFQEFFCIIFFRKKSSYREHDFRVKIPITWIQYFITFGSVWKSKIIIWFSKSMLALKQHTYMRIISSSRSVFRQFNVNVESLDLPFQRSRECMLQHNSEGFFSVSNANRLWNVGTDTSVMNMLIRWFKAFRQNRNTLDWQQFHRFCFDVRTAQHTLLHGIICRRLSFFGGLSHCCLCFVNYFEPQECSHHHKIQPVLLITFEWNDLQFAAKLCQ